MEEEWVPAHEFEGYYEVSNLGNVRSIDRELIIVDEKRGVSYVRKVKSMPISPSLDVDGYRSVALSIDGQSRSKRVGRLVLESFCPIDNMRELQCNHKDYNRQNDAIDNLEWTTGIENTHYSTKVHKPVPGPVRGVTDLTNNISYPSVRAAAKAITSSNADVTVRDAISNKRLYKDRVLIFTDQITSDFDRDDYIKFVKENDRKRHSVSHKKVTELKSGTVYSTVAKAVLSVNGTHAGLINSIRNHAPYKDKVFIYTDQIGKDFNIEEYIQEAYEGYTNPWKKTAVKDLTTGIIYTSTEKAGKAIGSTGENVRYALKHECEHYNHIFTTDLNMTQQEELDYIAKVRRRSGEGISCQVKDLTTGEIFASYEEARKSVDGSGGLQHALNNKVAYKGHVFIRLYDIDDSFDEQAYIDECIAKSLKHARKLTCKETGEVFKSIRAAADSFGVSTDVFGLRREENGTVIVFRGKHYIRTL